MGGQWTKEDPGAGSTGSLQSLALELRKTARLLGSDETDIQRSLGVFQDDWLGLSAEAAKACIEVLKSQAAEFASAAETVNKAVTEYAAEVDSIKALSDEQIAARDTAERREKTSGTS